MVSVDDDRVAALAPSAKVVYLVLQSNGHLDRGELRSRTALPEDTLDDALASLREAEVVDRQVVAGDARHRVYSLDDPQRP